MICNGYDITSASVKCTQVHLIFLREFLVHLLTELNNRSNCRNIIYLVLRLVLGWTKKWFWILNPPNSNGGLIKLQISNLALPPIFYSKWTWEYSFTTYILWTFLDLSIITSKTKSWAIELPQKFPTFKHVLTYIWSSTPTLLILHSYPGRTLGVVQMVHLHVWTFVI